jgi:hypothetical protein
MRGCIPDRRSKSDRLAQQSELIRGGCIHLPRGAAWVDGYIEEFVNYDEECADQVDATILFLEEVRLRAWPYEAPPAIAVGYAVLGSNPGPQPAPSRLGAVANATPWLRSRY